MTNRSDSLLPVNHHPRYCEEALLTEDSEHKYCRLPSLRKEENNILLPLASYLELDVSWPDPRSAEQLD